MPWATAASQEAAFHLGKIMQKKAIFYIDGFNLYFGMKSKELKDCYWLNIAKLCGKIIKPFEDQQIVSIKYFTDEIKGIEDKIRRQQAYLNALKTLKNVKIIYGHYYENKVLCKDCNLEHKVYKEKMTDVNIAVQILCDAFKNLFDVAYIISADSDLLPAIEAVKEIFPKKRIVNFTPPGRFSSALRKACHYHKNIYDSFIRNCQFPKILINEKGEEIKRPERWH